MSVNSGLINLAKKYNELTLDLLDNNPEESRWRCMFIRLFY